MKKLLGTIILCLLFVVNFASTSSAQEDYYFKNCNHQNYSYSYFIDLKNQTILLKYRSSTNQSGQRKVNIFTVEPDKITSERFQSSSNKNIFIQWIFDAKNNSYNSQIYQKTNGKINKVKNTLKPIICNEVKDDWHQQLIAEKPKKQEPKIIDYRATVLDSDLVLKNTKDSSLNTITFYPDETAFWKGPGFSYKFFWKEKNDRGHFSVLNEEYKKKNPDDNKIVAASSGTGFYVSNTGHIISNHHVVEGCNTVKLTFKGKEVSADVLAVDKMNDLAILKARSYSIKSLFSSNRRCIIIRRYNYCRLSFR
jgi:S1-C subfamily serine protease